MKVNLQKSLTQKIANRITRKKSAVILHKYFADLGSYTQIGQVLRAPVMKGKIIKTGYGLDDILRKTGGNVNLNSPHSRP